MTKKKLTRSKTDFFIGGVCGGFAEYFEIDATWIRLLAVLLIFWDLAGLILYILAWIVIPLDKKKPTNMDAEPTKKNAKKKETQ